MEDNIFIKLIRDGRIGTLGELKRAYHRVVMRTHPDAVGSDRLVDVYIRYSSNYEEAVNLLTRSRPDPGPPPVEERVNHRLLFFREFYRLETIDKPYAFKKFYHTEEEIELCRKRALEHFQNWKPQSVRLYREANACYDQVKRERPSGPYMKEALLLNLTPVFHNITCFHVIGLELYRRQLKQNLPAVLARLKDRGFHQLVEYIGFLIADMENGPAIHDLQ
jgi:hypothetical protein